MSDPPPASLLITPDLRRRLQQRYEEAVRLAAQPRPDHAGIHELFAECLRADPGNILYLDALLANLRRWSKTPKRLWVPTWLRWHSGDPKGASLREEDALPGTPYSVPGTPYGLLRRAPELLVHSPQDPGILRQLAEAAGECDLDEIELRYWQAAAECAPGDAESQRGLARALTRQGRFDEAVRSWFAIAALAPNAEAAQALADLRGAETSAGRAASPLTVPPADVESLVRLGRELRDQTDFQSSEECLARAQAMAGGDLAILEEREETRLARSRHHLAIARGRAEHDSHIKAQTLVQRLEVEHNRLEIEILNIRAERLPEDASVRIELARRLKRAGNFSGAIQRLEEALRLAPDDPAALVELGECWQHLRQFAKALGYYERALERRAGGASLGVHSLPATQPRENGPDPIDQLARYRAGVLAAAMGQTAAARSHFEAILAADPAYQDARERLDNLPGK